MPKVEKEEPKTPLEKSNARRANATAIKNDRATDKALLAVCKEPPKGSKDSQSTMAFGVLEHGGDRMIVVAFQTGTDYDASQLPMQSEEYSAYSVVTVDTKMQQPGLHAEMMIIRHLLLEKILDIHDLNGSAAEINLRIVCPRKKCCPDCAGYLRKHGIPHYPVNAGNASPNWINPRTGAAYRRTKTLLKFYDRQGETADVGDNPKKAATAGSVIGGGNIGSMRSVRQLLAKKS